ncbi:MAG: sugar phosphate isomerase/epimerase [Planctomycetes bacterium]|jgi:sugar phosphate isomerase/epimerase|nr:sugar phosphate isomerase/epimerase [Planctomycetota bacterium]
MHATPTGVDRRRFLAAATGFCGVGLLGGGRGLAAALPRFVRPLPPPLFEISLAQWSLHKTLFAKELDNLDFPKAARGFGITGIEYVNSFWKDKAKDAKYVAELKKRCADEGVTSVLIMCDGEGALGDPNEGARQKSVQNHHQWIDAAKELGCRAIRVNAQSSGSYEEQQKLAADGLRRLCEYGDKAGIDVIVENHGGLSSNGKWLSETLAKVAHPRCGALPDFGNFRIGKDEEYDRYLGVDQLMPFARGVSAKSHDFDEKGNEIHTDYVRMLDVVVKKHGWRGFIGIEYEGGKLSESDGIKATKALLELVRADLTARLAPAAAEPATGGKEGGK